MEQKILNPFNVEFDGNDVDTGHCKRCGTFHAIKRSGNIIEISNCNGIFKSEIVEHLSQDLKKVRKVLKYGTGIPIPDGAVYLYSREEKLEGIKTQEQRDIILIWHYFLVEVAE